MAFQRDEVVALSGPAAQGLGQCSQQDFIHPRIQRRRRFTQQTMCHLRVQKQLALFEILLGRAALGIVYRPDVVALTDLLQPLRRFGFAFRRLRREQQMLRPTLVAAGFRPEVNRRVRSQLPISTGQILQQHTPGNAVHH